MEPTETFVEPFHSMMSFCDVVYIVQCVNCQVQQSGARLGNRDVAPSGDLTRWYWVAVLQSWPQERQMYVTVLASGGPPQVWHT